MQVSKMLCTFQRCCEHLGYIMQVSLHRQRMINMIINYIQLFWGGVLGGKGREGVGWVG